MRLRVGRYRDCPGRRFRLRLDMSLSRYRGGWQLSLGYLRWGRWLWTAWVEERR